MITDLKTIKVSIVMAYFNRKEQLIQTLESIKKSLYKNIEIIIVDDNSRESQRVLTFIEEVKDNLDIKVITIEENEKTWINPCIPYNMGFAKATGDIIIIQNPEVMHAGDCISFIVENLELNDWITFNCYGSPGFKFNDNIKNQNGGLYDMICNAEKEMQDIYDSTPVYERYKFISCNPDLTKDGICFLIGGNSIFRDDIGGWLNHYTGHFVAYHYLSAIHKKDLFEKMNGGFDTKFQNGIGADDDEFIKRLIFNKFNFKITPFEKKYPFAIHLYHESVQRKNISSHKSNVEYFTESCKKMGFEPIIDIADKSLPKNQLPMSRRVLIEK
jgi:glycosyltransferase involved in cell wall biosynthesis